ncbi:unnamed protein product [Pieris brassicae]|uniref:Integrase catalytic domain-containing protein n=1 Tax=Pieris brassicae TaxID=7116 RepID=A0A9P0XIC8_PIEBR|nr:unnamed protein product [Pieris brassicae]
MSIRKFVENCVVCRTLKGPFGVIQAQMHPIQKLTTAFQIIYMDITGKLGTSENQQHVIVTIDAFTKYVILYHITNKDSHGTLAALKRTLLTLVDIDEPTTDIEALTNHVHQKMTHNAERDKLRFDSRKAKIYNFQRGDYVLIKNNPRNQTSLNLKFSEPFETTRILNQDRYLVKRVQDVQERLLMINFAEHLNLVNR